MKLTIPINSKRQCTPLLVTPEPVVIQKTIKYFGSNGSGQMISTFTPVHEKTFRGMQPAIEQHGVEHPDSRLPSQMVVTNAGASQTRIGGACLD